MPSKSERHEAIRERCREAIRNLYHNATPHLPNVDGEDVWEWFQGAAEFEIEYLNDGGAYGSDYRRTLMAECNAGRYKSEAARRYYVRKGMRDMQRERERCNSLDSRKSPVNCLWERITEYGKLYSYGRGGRTLAPADLMGRSSPREDYGDDLSISDCVELTRIVESFNQYVTNWNSRENLEIMWREANAEGEI